jgi:hypothetical protein
MFLLVCKWNLPKLKETFGTWDVLSTVLVLDCMVALILREYQPTQMS